MQEFSPKHFTGSLKNPIEAGTERKTYVRASSTSLRVCIQQPYLPAYRVPLFSELKKRLDSTGIGLDLVVGSPLGNQAARGDARHLPWAEVNETRAISIGKRSLVSVRLPRRASEYDLLVLDQALSNVQVWRSLVGSFGDRPLVALWGHGKILTRHASRIEQGLLRWVTNKADWFFAYTPGVVAELCSQGFPSERVTTMRNSTDTTALRTALEVVRRDQRELAANEVNALYIGGLDPAKGVELLLEAAAEVARNVPGFRLHLVGNGVESSILEEWGRDSSWLEYHGAVHDPIEKARIAAECGYMVLPGRVGLAVVDAFGLGLPVIATRGAGSAPEYEYLVDGRNAIITGRTWNELAAAMLEIGRNAELRNQLRHGACVSGSELSIEEMASEIEGGILESIERGHRSKRRGVEK